MKRIGVLGLVVALGLGLSIWWMLSRGKPPPDADAGDEGNESSTAADRFRAEPSRERPEPPPAPPRPVSQTTERQRALLKQVGRTRLDDERQRETLAQTKQANPVDPDAPASAPASRAALSKEEIQSAIRAVIPLVQECYTSGLKGNPKLKGKAVLTFTIVGKDGQGSIDEGEVKSSSLGDLKVETCLLHQLTKARFPVPSGEGKVTVSYPFNFSNSE